jgi:hypothetical protein
MRPHRACGVLGAPGPQHSTAALGKERCVARFNGEGKRRHRACVPGWVGWVQGFGFSKDKAVCARWRNGVGVIAHKTSEHLSPQQDYGEHVVVNGRDIGHVERTRPQRFGLAAHSVAVADAGFSGLVTRVRMCRFTARPCHGTQGPMRSSGIPVPQQRCWGLLGSSGHNWSILSNRLKVVAVVSIGALVCLVERQ